MFKVIYNLDDCLIETTVYGVRTQKGITTKEYDEFLIYDYGRWVWVESQYCAPVQKKI